MSKTSLFYRLLGVCILSGFFFCIIPTTSAEQITKGTVIYDFISKAPSATWRSEAGTLSFPGKDTDEIGFVLWREGVTLEDGSTSGLILQTHPQWVENGWISGTYQEMMLPENCNLIMKVGFLNGAQGSDGVTYQVKIHGQSIKSKTIVDIPAGNDQRLDEATVNLTNYAKKAVFLEIIVKAGTSSGQDWATWVEAKIIQTEPEIHDSDQDGIPDTQDNCPENANPEQQDSDGDSQGDACDPFDNRDIDGDGIRDEDDTCPKQPETLNNYLDQDGCPDLPPTPTFVLVTTLPELIIPPIIEPPEEPIEPNIEYELEFKPDWSSVLEGPIMQEAFNDGDEDGVLNYEDECPITPVGSGVRVLPNGCFCMDSDNGSNRAAFLTAGNISIRYSGGSGSYSDGCRADGTLIEYSCNPLAEESILPENQIYNRIEVDCNTLGDLPYGVEWSCLNERCIPQSEAIPNYCFSSDGTCADGVQNQGETGIDCGGICPPCNTRCTTGTRYAPADTPCTSIFPDDPHEVELYWTDSWLENTCQTYEICHPDLDHVIEEATRCCSIPNHYSGMTWLETRITEETTINEMPDPDLCRAARGWSGSAGGCSRCVSLYIIKGMGEYARWMVGYNSLYPTHNIDGIGSQPAESLINDLRTGICRDYSLATATLLRKAGLPQTSVNNYCDGNHCYNVVKIPGDTLWHIVDTTGNNVGIVMGSIPGSHPYCTRLSPEYLCFNGVRPNGDPCDGSERRVFDFPAICQPAGACERDLFSTPGVGPFIDEIIGCR